MSKDRLIQSIALAANCVTILGLLLVILQLRQNRSLMRAQVRHELATTIVDLLNSSAGNSQLAGVLRRAGRGVHYQYRLGLYDEVEYERQKAAWKATFVNSVGFVHYWSQVRTLYSPRFASEIDGLQPPEPVKQPALSPSMKKPN
jgi:hypothetical protein